MSGQTGVFFSILGFLTPYMYYFGYHAFCRLKVLERLHGPYVRVPSRSATLAPLRVCTALEFVCTRRWNECETEYVTLFFFFLVAFVPPDMSTLGLVCKPHGPPN